MVMLIQHFAAMNIVKSPNTASAKTWLKMEAHQNLADAQTGAVRCISKSFDTKTFSSNSLQNTNGGCTLFHILNTKSPVAGWQASGHRAPARPPALDNSQEPTKLILSHCNSSAGGWSGRPIPGGECNWLAVSGQRIYRQGSKRRFANIFFSTSG